MRREVILNERINQHRLRGRQSRNSKGDLPMTTREEIGKKLCELIMAYWTPERVALWEEYEKTDRSIPWQEYERTHREEQTS